MPWTEPETGEAKPHGHNMSAIARAMQATLRMRNKL
jgi:hypothetical protein